MSGLVKSGRYSDGLRKRAVRNGVRPRGRVPAAAVAAGLVPVGTGTTAPGRCDNRPPGAGSSVSSDTGPQPARPPLRRPRSRAHRRTRAHTQGSRQSGPSRRHGRLGTRRPLQIEPPKRSYRQDASEDPRQLRIAVTTTPFIDVDIDPACVASTSVAVERCAALGHHVVEAHPVFDAGAFERHFLGVWAAARRGRASTGRNASAARSNARSSNRWPRPSPATAPNRALDDTSRTSTSYNVSPAPSPTSTPTST